MKYIGLNKKTQEKVNKTKWKPKVILPVDSFDQLTVEKSAHFDYCIPCFFRSHLIFAVGPLSEKII